jgi:CHASE3 domain sensor protein
VWICGYGVKETEINIWHNGYGLFYRERIAQVEAETTSAEELQQKRLDRAKAMVSWKWEEPNQVFSLQVTEVLAETLEASEEVLRGSVVAKFADADATLVDRMRSKLRKMHRSVKDQYLKASVANRLGVQAVSKIFKLTG